MACRTSRVPSDADHAAGDAGRRVRNRHRPARTLVDNAIAVSATRRRAVIERSHRATAPASSAIVDRGAAVAVAHHAAPMTSDRARPA
jgi:hypothetical protein